MGRTFLEEHAYRNPETAKWLRNRIGAKRYNALLEGERHRRELGYSAPKKKEKVVRIGPDGGTEPDTAEAMTREMYGRQIDAAQQNIADREAGRGEAIEMAEWMEREQRKAERAHSQLIYNLRRRWPDESVNRPRNHKSTDDAQQTIWTGRYHRLAQMLRQSLDAGMFKLDSVKLPRVYRRRPGQESHRPCEQALLNLVYTLGKMAIRGTPKARKKVQWTRQRVPKRYRHLGAVSLSNKTLALALGYSVRSIVDSKRKLCESGHLVRILVDGPNGQKRRRLPAILIACHPDTLKPGQLWQATEQDPPNDLASYPTVRNHGRKYDQYRLATNLEPRKSAVAYILLFQSATIGIVLQPITWNYRPPG